MRRVVITSMGAITPVGNHVEEFWSSLKNGVNGIDYIKAFDTDDFKVKLAAEVRNFNPENYMDKKDTKRMDRYCQFALAAAKEAMDKSNLDINAIDKDKFGVIVGSGIGGFSTFEKEHENYLNKGPKRVSPFFIPMMISNIASGNVAIKYGAKGPCYCVTTACASGTHAIGEAFRNIKHGYMDMALTGGCEGAITPLAVAGFQGLTALSTSQDINRASLPFNKNRDGFVMGEGSGILLIEELQHALKRGAKIYGEIVGYGATCDAYHMTSPDPKGEGAKRAMNLAISEGKISHDHIGYINAHGTGTLYNDKFETEAIKNLFKERAYEIPVSSTKSMTGHLLGAAGAIEAIACIKALEDSFLPPTINLNYKDEDCDLDYVPNEGRKKNIKYAMSNSLGFGGHNGTLLFKKWEGK